MTPLYVGITDCPDCGTHWLSTADTTAMCDTCHTEREQRARLLTYVAYVQSRCTGDETSDADPGL